MSDVFADLLESFVIPCVCVCMSDMFVWSSSLSGPSMRSVLRPSGSARDFAPLAGKSGIVDTFAGVLEPFAPLCTCPHTSSAFAWLSSPWTLAVYVPPWAPG